MQEMEPDLTGELSRADEAATSGISPRVADLDSEVDDPTLEFDPEVAGDADDDDDTLDGEEAAELAFADL